MGNKLDDCTRVLMAWTLREQRGIPDNPPQELLDGFFIYKMLKKKFEVFKINIYLPTELILLLDICCDSNPGQVQIVLKDLLMSTKGRRGLLHGDTIRADDFSNAFPWSFPIMSDRKISEKYQKLWDEQKTERGNLCDTPDWWLEAML